MIKKIVLLSISALLLINMYGCVALLAGTAGGAGTATWLSGKLGQEVGASYEKTILAVKSSLRAFKFELTKETRTEEMAQLMSKYGDGRTIWIDVRKISDNKSRVEVRVGMAGDKEAARKILNKILNYL
jgi:hypothetical protein